MTTTADAPPAGSTASEHGASEHVDTLDPLPVTGPLRWDPHVAYRVADVEAALQGHEVLYGPFEVGGGFCKAAFVLHDGAVIEFMQYTNPDEEGWF